MTTRPPHRVFFDGPEGYVDLGASAYAQPQQHLDDELGIAELRLDRAHAVLTAASTAALDLQIESRGRWIEERLAATTVPLPLVELATRLALSPPDLAIVVALLAVELDARRLARLPGEQPPPTLTATTLWAAIAPTGITLPTWIRHLFGPGSVVQRGIVVRVDDPLPQAQTAAAPLRLSRNVLGSALGTALGEPLLEGVLLPLRAQRNWAGGTEVKRLAASVVARTARGVALWITGGDDGLSLAVAVAAAAGRRLFAIDIRTLIREQPWARGRLLQALRLDQKLHDWVGLIDAREGSAGAPEWASELRALDETLDGPLIAISTGDVVGLTAIAGTALRHTIARPGSKERGEIWTQALRAAGSTIAERQILELADAFPMTAGEIHDVIAGSHRTLETTDGEPGIDAYRSACLARQHVRLGRLADFVPRSFTWEDLVVAPDELERLREIVERQRHRHTVFTEWNMISKLPYGSGIAALFSGPPGTGKTMAAAVLAAELGRQLYRVDLSRIVDKFIGETEKNLGRIFDAAADADALLLFDEADSLFGKRTTVSSSNDRYANLETNYLLQRIEAHPGISILTTNYAQNIDEAFARRIPFRVEFPFPDAKARAQIWRRCFDPAVPRDELDFRDLGARFELSGGHIKSAVVRATFMAASAGTPVSKQHVARAAARELESLGKLAMT